MSLEVLQELRECGRLNKPGTWDFLRLKHNVPIEAANASWNAGVAQRLRPSDTPPPITTQPTRKP